MQRAQRADPAVAQAAASRRQRSTRRDDRMRVLDPLQRFVRRAEAGLGVAARLAAQLLEEHLAELRRRVDVEGVAGERFDLGLRARARSRRTSASARSSCATSTAMPVSSMRTSVSASSRYSASNAREAAGASARVIAAEASARVTATSAARSGSSSLHALRSPPVPRTSPSSGSERPSTWRATSGSSCGAQPLGCVRCERHAESVTMPASVRALTRRARRASRPDRARTSAHRRRSSHATSAGHAALRA